MSCKNAPEKGVGQKSSAVFLLKKQACPKTHWRKKPVQEKKAVGSKIFLVKNLAQKGLLLVKNPYKNIRWIRIKNLQKEKLHQKFQKSMKNEKSKNEKWKMKKR